MADHQALSPAISLNFSAGMDNRARETDMPEGSWRTLDNVDVAREGNILTRPGARRVDIGVWHSLVSYAGGLYGVKDGVLGRYDTSFIALTTLTPNTPVRYAEHNGDLYWTTPYQQGRITPYGASYWGLATPPQIQASAVFPGGLDAGDYQITLTAVNSEGLESGAPEPVLVKVVENGGIDVTVPTGATFRVYRTPANGGRDELRLAATVATGATAKLRSAQTGKRLESLYAIKPLPGQSIISFKGRLWVASGSVLWFTSHLSPHWLIPSSYFSFPTTIQMIDATEDGLYVATDRQTWFLAGADPNGMAQRLVAPIGAIATATALDLAYDALIGDGQPAARQAAWVDTEGYLCLGKPGGMIVRPHKGRYSMGLAGPVALAFVQRQGLRQLLALARDDDTLLAATDGAITEVFANGITLGG